MLAPSHTAPLGTRGGGGDRQAREDLEEVGVELDEEGGETGTEGADEVDRSVTDGVEQNLVLVDSVFRIILVLPWGNQERKKHCASS